ncbi:MAG: hypothetical protein Q7T54_04160 [Candidatus Levybacteria bacterium]|nr:hypothetical protein [Candidatus Levybacteria bacterium]
MNTETVNYSRELFDSMEGIRDIPHEQVRGSARGSYRNCDAFAGLQEIGDIPQGLKELLAQDFSGVSIRAHAFEIKGDVNFGIRLEPLPMLSGRAISVTNKPQRVMREGLEGETLEVIECDENLIDETAAWVSSIIEKYK